MPLLAEQERSITNESNLISDATVYSRNNAAWGTIHDYGSIVLTDATLIIFKYTRNAVWGGNPYSINTRLRFGSLYVTGYAEASVGGFTARTEIGLIWLPAGTHTVIMESINTIPAGAPNVQVSAFQLGKVQLNDVNAKALHIYTAAFGIVLPPRLTPAGMTKQGQLIINVYAATPAAATNFENVGDALTNGVQINVDGVQKNWTIRHQDSVASVYGAGQGIYAVPYNLQATAYSITVTKDNANTALHVTAIFCPWVLGSTEHEPLSLDFPQGGTFGCIFEPLFLDPTKTGNLGKVRAITFGAATDYYSTISGTGLQTHSYTFEVLKVTSARYVVAGWGGCISHVLADWR